jgi:hypothetical protein
MAAIEDRGLAGVRFGIGPGIGIGIQSRRVAREGMRETAASMSEAM